MMKMGRSESGYSRMEKVLEHGPDDQDVEEKFLIRRTSRSGLPN